MTTTYQTTAVPPSVVAALVLPELDEVTPEQARGVRCVWCPTALTTETAVDMGEHLATDDGRRARWYPRACHPCAARRAHRGLFAHTAHCQACRTTAAGCEVGRILVRLLREGHR
ncbi:hypothetical protein [Streptomyces sp. enrichment culture]|uniref:hypothetical protein n=1 Tax=Streptomyces sp. enrichment culture TaxID=1795815 RepID=UPI003F55B784